ncbi:MAG: HPr family phosphocarrier protein [Epsilonproteobacteria bacterium]|nr:MAG: HPr family phosphocarrier protein [Campylobacterota bacterium]
MSLLKHLFSKPLATQLTITSSNGFHLRPVAQFSSLAKSFPCKITATFQKKTVDAKSVNTLLSLSLEKEDTFTLQIQGKKSEEAREALVTLFETLMQTDIQIKKSVKTASDYEGSLIEGDIIYEGIAIAPVYHYARKEVQHKTNVSFKEALQYSINELEDLYLLHKKEDNATIYLAQKELLASLGEKSESLTNLEQIIVQEADTLLGTKLESKRADYQDILQRVKKHLGLEIKVTFPNKPFILLSNDLLPSEIDALSETQVLGVILQETSIHSHAAILLRAAGIASLIAETKNISQNTPLILDSHAGVVLCTPSANDLQKATLRLEQDVNQNALSASKRFDLAATIQGKEIKVLANVGDLNSARVAKEEGAEGIGLLRSEFLFKANKPSFETQQKAYREIFSFFDDITVRTLDVGGDKALPYIEIPVENNPFLGVRGVRLFTTHPELLEEQLHAIFMAAGEKHIKIMFPMVSSVEEFTQAKAFAQNIAKKHRLDISHIDFGIMIEVPSVLFLLEDFNKVVDFYSIGTNDLSQYLFAIERTHPTLKVDALSPVLFSAIDMIRQKATKPVSICGELAANKAAIEKLVHLGIETLSVSPKSIAQTKEFIRHV